MFTLQMWKVEKKCSTVIIIIMKFWLEFSTKKKTNHENPALGAREWLLTLLLNNIMSRTHHARTSQANVQTGQKDKKKKTFHFTYQIFVQIFGDVRRQLDDPDKDEKESKQNW